MEFINSENLKLEAFRKAMGEFAKSAEREKKYFRENFNTAELTVEDRAVFDLLQSNKLKYSEFENYRSRLWKAEKGKTPENSSRLMFLSFVADKIKTIPPEAER